MTDDDLRRTMGHRVYVGRDEQNTRARNFIQRDKARVECAADNHFLTLC